MTKTTLFMNGRSQAVRIPKELRLPGKEVSIRRVGPDVLIEPIARPKWPRGFFGKIRVHDPAFSRPDQGRLPVIPDLES